MARMAKLDRLLRLVNALNDTVEGLTLDEMAAAIDADRRTAERLRDVIRAHFDLDEVQGEDRRKKFRIRESLRRHYTRPNAGEIAALQAAAEAARRSGSAQAPILENLLAKIKGSLDTVEKNRLAPDLEPLAALQRRYVPAGPLLDIDNDALAHVQGAIMAGQCLEFEYRRDGANATNWRRVIPVGLIHGPVTYVIGKLPGKDMDPVPYRLDRMSEIRASNEPGCVDEDWDLDSWMAGSFGIWREDAQDIVLRVDASAAQRARQWRFHPQQVLEDGENGELIVRFRSGGLREIAEHLFTWGGEVRIESPDELRETMRQRIEAAQEALQ